VVDGVTGGVAGGVAGGVTGRDLSTLALVSGFIMLFRVELMFGV